MHLHMQQHASINSAFLKFFFVLITCGVSLFALDMPITERTPVILTSQGKSIIEFPFAVTLRADDFIPSKDQQNGAIPPVIKKGENVVEFDSKSAGSVEFAVLGGDRPFFLKAVFEPGGEKYYRLLPPKASSDDVKDFESNDHETVVTNLAVAAYRQQAPKGYSVSTKTAKLNVDNLQLQLNFEYTGNEYAVQSWVVSNHGTEAVDLYEEMFANEVGQNYGISIISSVLNPGENTTLLVVKSAQR
ncbi:MAG: type-F conjugative transfer system secretin TraK [Campylobacterales bacterium]|nr:type-F conjugative transfer system secretin TraK [Campylobacterales bacterium]